jgi:uncharacterized protein YdaT
MAPVTTKGAKYKSNRRKTKSLRDLAKSNFQAPHQLELTTASLERSQKEQKRTEQTKKIRRSIKHNQDQKSVETKRSMLHCKGVLDQSSLSRPIQPTSCYGSWVFHVFIVF